MEDARGQHSSGWGVGGETLAWMESGERSQRRGLEWDVEKQQECPAEQSWEGASGRGNSLDKGSACL